MRFCAIENQEKNTVWINGGLTHGSHNRKSKLEVAAAAKALAKQ
jgi:hypothetical protein